MKHSLKQVTQLELHHRYLLFERSETAGQVAAGRAGIHALQNLGTGEIGEASRPRLGARFLQRAVFVLAQPEYHHPVSRLAGHRRNNDSVRIDPAVAAQVE